MLMSCVSLKPYSVSLIDCSTMFLFSPLAAVEACPAQKPWCCSISLGHHVFPNGCFNVIHPISLSPVLSFAETLGFEVSVSFSKGGGGVGWLPVTWMLMCLIFHFFFHIQVPLAVSSVCSGGWSCTVTSAAIRVTVATGWPWQQALTHTHTHTVPPTPPSLSVILPSFDKPLQVNLQKLSTNTYTKVSATYALVLHSCQSPPAAVRGV